LIHKDHKCHPACKEGLFSNIESNKCFKTPCLAELDGFYYNQELNKCLNCPFGCTKCVSSTECIKC